MAKSRLESTGFKIATALAFALVIGFVAYAYVTSMQQLGMLMLGKAMRGYEYAVPERVGP